MGIFALDPVSPLYDPWEKWETIFSRKDYPLTVYEWPMDIISSTELNVRAGPFESWRRGGRNVGRGGGGGWEEARIISK